MRALVTGASSGIGEATARHLASLGWEVFAGVRKDADAERLAGTPNVTPLKLDVTDEKSIRTATAEIGDRLDGLVNNAGIAVTGPLELLPLAEYRRQLEVNVIGQIAVTQALIPALRSTHGRIAFMSSIGGVVALPMVGPYAASKFAIEAITDSLRRELRPWRIHVAAIEPGAIATPIWDKGSAEVDRLTEEMGAENVDGLYGGIIRNMRAEVADYGTTGTPPEKVAQAVAHALTAKRPRTRYLVGGDAKQRAFAARWLPDRVFDALVARQLDWK